MMVRKWRHPRHRAAIVKTNEEKNNQNRHELWRGRLSASAYLYESAICMDG